MYCAYCNCNISKDATKCPNCGQALDDSTKALNPKPQNFIVNNETPLIGELVTNEAVTQDVILGQSTNVKTESIYPNNTVTEDEQNGETIQVQTTSSTIYDFSSAVKAEPIITNEDKSALHKDTTTAPNNNVKSRKGIFVLIPAIIIIAIVIVLVTIKQKNNTTVDDTGITTTEQITTTEDNIATGTDLLKPEISFDELNIIELVDTKQVIIINNEEVTPSKLDSYAIENSDTIITKSIYELSTEEARMYIDEQEVLFQLEDPSILDVVYVNSAYRYHYVGYYQYGVYDSGKLFVFTITDDMETQEADILACEYFTEMGVQ